ncbi:uncharacterized protein LOC114469285 isoform X3 [Gouania willdenowi]|uniref:uncharacterized protein LOC114469285 isoform X3 n=1 Tax=Gouania willdenowi TaxID=441366 RepID=UPI001054313B|nr:uncharacterized protein LOC114469285 isoform X3 [Gouania willdenowi]
MTEIGYRGLTLFMHALHTEEEHVNAVEKSRSSVNTPAPSLGSGQKSSWSRDSSSSPVSVEEDHVYSFPNKQKISDSSTAGMSSALGSNLSELDRLLLELNAVQQSSPSFPTTEEAAPPLPSCSITHYDNGSTPDILISPPLQEKPKRNGTRLEEAQPTVESLLDELKGSVPTPSPLDSSSQQARISASCATRELDELMASLSDFKPNSLGSLLEPAPAFPNTNHLPVSSVTSVVSPPFTMCHPSASPLFPLPAGFELHIDEDGGGVSIAHPSCLPLHSPASSLSAASDLELDSVIDVSAPMLSTQTRSLLVVSQSSSPNSNLMRNCPLHLNTTTPSLTSVITVLHHKSSKSPSPTVERLSPSASVSKLSCAPETLGSTCFNDLEGNFFFPPSLKNLTPPLSMPFPLSVAVSMSPPSPHTPLQTASLSPVSALIVPSPLAFTSASKQLPEAASISQRASPLQVEPSLDEALDTLLKMSFTQNQSEVKIEAQCLDNGIQKVSEELILPMDRSSVQPDTFNNTITDDSVDGGTDGNGDLDWADEELSMSFHDGLDGTMTPYTERPYTDGSLTPLTEASWMDEFMTPSSCPGTPDVALDLPLIHTPNVDRVSASGHIKAVIRRTKEMPNVHPMYRDSHLRRKMGPMIVNKSSSQDRLIEELQGKLGIGRSERRRKQSDDWLTEGVVVMSKPQHFRPEGATNEVDKVGFCITIPPDSPVPVRKVLPPLSPTAPRYPPVIEDPRRPLPVQQPQITIPLLPPPPQPTHTDQSVPDAPLLIRKSTPRQVPFQDHPSPKPELCPPVHKTPTHPPPMEPTPPAAPKVLVSVGCQTEFDPVFPPMQIMAQGKGGLPGGVPTQVNKLDNMLGSLQSDLNKLGVQTVAKGVCGACCKPIVGQVVTAMGRTWHPEHFVCTHCQEEIGSRNFFEREGQPYCEKDYHTLFSPRCYYCNGPILDKVVTALDQTWHPEHFFCAQCGSFFGPEGFHEKDGKAYCRKDYFDMFAPKCGGCARAILENYISALNSLWHPECFVCRECFTPFVNGSFFEHDGQPYCEVHYHERRGSLCSGCQKPITGRCITAMAKKFHPEHFVCAFCLKQLNKGTFKEQNDKPYCHGCFIKLFS